MDFQKVLDEITTLQVFHADLQADPQLAGLKCQFDEIRVELDGAKTVLSRPELFSQREIDSSKLIVEDVSMKLTSIYELLAEGDDIENSDTVFEDLRLSKLFPN